MSVERPDNSISFLEKVATVQKLQHDLESRRVALDRQLNTRVVKLDLKMAKQKSHRLEQYYRKICEDERRATIRNEKIREDLARAETRLKWMSQRTDRFKALKDEYEKMVEREYPGWLEQLASYQKIKEEKRRNEMLLASSAINYVPPNPPTYSAPMSSTPNPPQFVGSLGSTMTSQPTFAQNQLLPSGFPPIGYQGQPTWPPPGLAGAQIPGYLSQQPAFGYGPPSSLNGNAAQPSQSPFHAPAPYVWNEQQTTLQPPVNGSMPVHPPLLELRAQNLNYYQQEVQQDQTRQDLEKQMQHKQQQKQYQHQEQQLQHQHQPQQQHQHREQQPQYQQQPAHYQQQEQLHQQQLITNDNKPKVGVSIASEKKPVLTEQMKRLSIDQDEHPPRKQQPQRQVETQNAKTISDKEATPDVVEEYKKTLEHVDLGYSPYSKERREDDDKVERSSGRDSVPSRDQERKTSDSERPEEIKGDGFKKSASSKEPKMKRIISIPSANDEDDDDDVDDDDEQEKYSDEADRERDAEGYRDGSVLGQPSKEVEDKSPRRSPQPGDSSFKPTVGGCDLAGTLDMLDSSLGSVDSASLPDMSAVQSAGVERRKNRDGSENGSANDKSEVKSSSRASPLKEVPNMPAMGVKKKATAPPATQKSNEKSKAQEFGRLGRMKSEDDEDDDDDIFGREEKKDAKVKEEANLAYQRMMSTMKSESSTSRAVNTNQALDSSSEDELENAIQKAVLGNKGKKEVGSPPLKSLSPRSPPGASSGSKSPSSQSGSPVRSGSASHSAANPPKKPSPQQTPQQSTTKYQPKKTSNPASAKPNTNFGMFSASVPSSSGSRPPHLRRAGSDSDLDDDVSSDGDRRKRPGKKSSSGAAKNSDDDFDFYG